MQDRAMALTREECSRLSRRVMMVGSIAYFNGWGRFDQGDKGFLPFFTNRLKITGNPPPPRPTKVYPRHFNNRCQGGGLRNGSGGRQRLQLKKGRVWLNNRPHVFCCACGKLCGPKYHSYIPDGDRGRNQYGWLPRVCEECYRRYWTAELAKEAYLATRRERAPCDCALYEIYA